MILDRREYIMNYSKYYNSMSNEQMFDLMGAFLPFIIFGLLISLAIGIFMMATYWKLFEKAGKPGWTAIVPFYNIWIMLEITKLPGWLILLLLIPGLNAPAGTILMVIVGLNMAKAFGKEIIFAIGLILLPVIFYPILAFSKDATYDITRI